MARLDIKASFTNPKGNIEVRLSLILFKEDNIHYVYSPALDLTGYGKTEKEASDSFELMLKEFIKYTTNKKTLFDELKRLGWRVSGTKNKRKVSAPSMAELLRDNEQFNEIVNEHEYTKKDKAILLPA